MECQIHIDEKIKQKNINVKNILYKNKSVINRRI